MLNENDITPEMSQYFEVRASPVIKSVQRRLMNGHYVATRQEALNLILDMIPPDVVVGCGDSLTLRQLDIIPELVKRNQNKIINPVQTDKEGQHLPREQRADVQRQALLSDVFLTGTNAITLDGRLVNIDGAGNRVAAMAFGPRKVIVVAGANKIVNDVAAAMDRIHNFATPVNSMRLSSKHGNSGATNRPCVLTGKCTDCYYEWRACRYTLIVEGCQPPEKGRITVIIVGGNMGI